jgi:GrpB-like predicted nucleotidyltransferase (UPF0157 family)
MEVVPYNKQWPKMFQAEKVLLSTKFGNKIIDIQHIGSTAIPDMAAKPIIDIAIMIESRKDADGFTPLVAQIGYRFHSLSSERHYYVKDEPIECHLSIAYVDRGGFWKRQLLFRDYLIQHNDLAHEYAALKKHLIEKYPDGSQPYTDGKNEFVQNILLLAEKTLI